MRSKKSGRVKRSLRSTRSTRSRKARRLRDAYGVGAIGLAVIGIVAAAMLVAAYSPSPRTSIASVAAPQAGVETPVKKPAAAPGSAEGTSPAGAPVADATVVGPTEEAAVATPVPVTITGCLERSDEMFRLTDTAGASAPRSRSWKSGFLKKSPASVDVVDAAHRLKLPAYVGQRVSVTGTLRDREMRVRSLQRVAPSCSDGTKVKI